MLRAAVALADDAGIESLTMRELAMELGVVPMALYKHCGQQGRTPRPSGHREQCLASPTARREGAVSDREGVHSYALRWNLTHSHPPNVLNSPSRQ